MDLPVVIGLIAACLAIIGTVLRLLGWMRSRFARLAIDITFVHGHTRLARVTVRNPGHRPVVLTEFGITRCDTRRFRSPASGNARGRGFSNGERLERHDQRAESFPIDGLPPAYDGQALWGYAVLSHSPKRHLSGEPLRVQDQRPGSPTAGQYIYP
jgi:hypothetical protein